MKEEKWEWYKGSENRYKISSLGNLLSFCRSKNGRLRKGVLALGYLQVQVWIEGEMVFKKIHRMVAETFIPNPENKREVNHKNGIKTDNRVENLDWCTPSENILHAYRVLGKKNNFSDMKGEGHYKSRYKNEDIIKIREMYNSGITTREIAALFNDSTKCILRIAKRLRWKHI